MSLKRDKPPKHGLLDLLPRRTSKSKKDGILCLASCSTQSRHRSRQFCPSDDVWSEDNPTNVGNWKRNSWIRIRQTQEARR